MNFKDYLKQNLVVLIAAFGLGALAGPVSSKYGLNFHACLGVACLLTIFFGVVRLYVQDKREKEKQCRQTNGI